MSKLNDEQIKALLEKAKRPEYNRQIKGYSPTAVNGKMGFEKNVKGGKPGWVKPAPVSAPIDWGLTPLKKRLPRERAEALTKRLYEAAQKSPAELEFILKKAQGEMWQAGKTYSYEDIRKVADELMKKAAADEAERNRRTF